MASSTPPRPCHCDIYSLTQQIERLNLTSTKELAFIQVTVLDGNYQLACESLKKIRKEQNTALDDIVKKLNDAKHKASSNFRELQYLRQENQRRKSTTAPSYQLSIPSPTTSSAAGADDFDDLGDMELSQVTESEIHNVSNNSPNLFETSKNLSQDDNVTDNLSQDDNVTEEEAHELISSQ